MTLIYNGQETGETHLPSLFDKDTISWKGGTDLAPLMKKLYEIKQDKAFAESDYTVSSPCDGVLCAMHKTTHTRVFGAFPVSSCRALVNVELPDGIYENLISGDSVEVKFGMLSLKNESIIIKA